MKNITFELHLGIFLHYQYICNCKYGVLTLTNKHTGNICKRKIRRGFFRFNNNFYRKPKESGIYTHYNLIHKEA